MLSKVLLCYSEIASCATIEILYDVTRCSTLLIVSVCPKCLPNSTHPFYHVVIFMLSLGVTLGFSMIGASQIKQEFAMNFCL